MLSPRSRREAIEQGKAELNRLYEQLPESAHDLSLRDLVEHPTIPLSGGLPVEQRQEGLPPDVAAFGSATAFFFSVTSSPPRSTSGAATTRGVISARIDAPPPPLPVSVKHISPRKVSPRPSPPPSPRSGIKSLPASPVWRIYKEPQVKPILPALSFDHGVHSKCSSCSAHVIFFKTKCQVCSRLYCNRCVKRATCTSKCGQGCFSSSHSQEGSAPTKRRGILPGSSCWPFPITKASSRPRSKTGNGDSIHPASADF
ncbi:hypothetical protein SELMODRAFT_440605 [Selaginella moellendorffii]|uniref:Uncharacterized protein n=1 Tax=Selaginella moellendorffii TaxID=88036 RepID=D8RCX2_SELML|nr:uncharacterized protein LOC9651224 [Selaginella moellendorffii]EFJ29919.1 hypothetical protein SELMODRAFT_440605 [Selaginella moellendorffii]|eukprot:XP_002968803.1 uncharacterized protein LOC9651224 [Selaginella moellendorffii]